MANVSNSSDILWLKARSSFISKKPNKSLAPVSLRHTEQHDDSIKPTSTSLAERAIKLTDKNDNSISKIFNQELAKLSAGEINTNIFMNNLTTCITENQQKPTEEDFLTSIKLLTPKQIKKIKDQSGCNLVMWSVLADTPKITQWLIQQKIINPNAVDIAKNTAVQPDTEMLQILLSQSKSKINEQKNKKETAIVLAAKNIPTFGTIQLIKYLHLQGANPYLKDDDNKNVFDYLQDAKQHLENRATNLLNILDEVRPYCGSTKHLTSEQINVLSIALKKQDVDILLAISTEISEDALNFEQIIEELSSKKSLVFKYNSASLLYF